MAIYKVQNNKFVELKSVLFESEKVYEVAHLQKYIANSIEMISPDLLVIATEFSDWEDSRRSIDILCVDTEGNLVVIEIKRTREGGHMELQALRYAAMVNNMKFEKAVSTFEKYLRNSASDHDAKETLLKFLGWHDSEKGEFAQDVKIILISSDFSLELTTSILWLIERGIDIKCVRIKPQKDVDTLYYDIQQIIPLPEAADYQVRLREKMAEERVARTENTREQSIITRLFDAERLKVGQKVILKPGIDQGIDKEKVSATIVRRGRNCLQRENDEALYSFSSLRSRLTQEFGLVDIRPEWGFSLRNDWITEDGKTLAELE